MKSEKEIRELLEKVRESKVIGVDYFCVDCRKRADDDCFSNGHTIIINVLDHDGLFEWYRCLQWVLGEKVEEY